MLSMKLQIRNVCELIINFYLNGAFLYKLYFCSDMLLFFQNSSTTSKHAFRILFILQYFGKYVDTKSSLLPMFIEFIDIKMVISTSYRGGFSLRQIRHVPMARGFKRVQGRKKKN